MRKTKTGLSQAITDEFFLCKKFWNLENFPIAGNMKEQALRKENRRNAPREHKMEPNSEILSIKCGKFPGQVSIYLLIAANKKM